MIVHSVLQWFHYLLICRLQWHPHYPSLRHKSGNWCCCCTTPQRPNLLNTSTSELQHQSMKLERKEIIYTCTCICAVSCHFTHSCTCLYTYTWLYMCKCVCALPTLYATCLVIFQKRSHNLLPLDAMLYGKQGIE